MSDSKVKLWTKQLLLKLGLDVRISRPHDVALMQQSLLSSSDVTDVIDGGAYHGEWTAIYRRMLPTARVHAFEPFPESFAVLQRSFGDDAQVVLNQSALGSSQGDRTLNVQNLAATNSFLPIDPRLAPDLPEPSWVRPNGSVTVRVTTIDHYLESTGIERIGVVKLDVQGTELDVLLGTQKALEDGRIGILYLELLLSPAYVGQAEHFEISAFLADFGYRIFGLYNFAMARTGRLMQCDAVFVGPQLRLPV